MDHQGLLAWLIDEKAVADTILSDADVDPFQSESGPWLRDDDGNWKESKIDVYQGLHLEIELGPIPESRFQVEQFLSEQATENPIPYGLYPFDPDRHAEYWTRSALSDFFRKLRPDCDVDELTGKVAENLLLDAHRDHQVIVERVLLMRPEVNETIGVGDYVVRPPDASDMDLVTGRGDLRSTTIPTTWMGVLPQSVLEHRYQAPLDAKGHPQRLQELLVGLMLADVSFATISGSVRHADSYRNMGFAFSAPIGEKWPGSKEFDAELLQQAVELAGQCRDSEKGIDRSCQRLLRSTRDFVDPSDRIIDIVIAMESLLTDDSRDQLSYQFRVLGALLLGDSYEERLEIKDELKQAYKERSLIVHSNRVTDWNRERIDGLAGMARRLCRNFVENERPDFDALLMGES